MTCWIGDTSAQPCLPVWFVISEDQYAAEVPMALSEALFGPHHSVISPSAHSCFLSLRWFLKYTLPIKLWLSICLKRTQLRRVGGRRYVWESWWYTGVLEIDNLLPPCTEDPITGCRRSTDSPWHKVQLLKLSGMVNWNGILWKGI